MPPAWAAMHVINNAQQRPRECSHLRGRFAYGGGVFDVGTHLRTLKRPPFFQVQGVFVLEFHRVHEQFLWRRPAKSH